jgi:secreted trypsin-like serine protease
MKKASTLLLVLGLLLATASSARAAPDAGPRIAGGGNAPSWFMPATTYLRYGYPWDSFCSASLIAPKRVLTAAHCVDEQNNPKLWTAFVGARDVGDHSTPRDGDPIGVTGIASHPQHRTPYYDVAIMFLKRPARVPPTPVAAPSEQASGGYALGWGHYNYNHSAPQYQGPLKTAFMNWGSPAFCRSYTAEYDPAIILCTWNSGYDCTTHGDSGGPFVVDINGVYKQVGVLRGTPGDIGDAGTPCEIGAGGSWMSIWAWISGPVLRPYIFGVGNPACPPARKKFKRVKRIWTKRSKQFRSARKFKKQACQGI